MVETVGAMVNEPIAVIGSSCRLPGAASPEQFWTLLEAGRDAITEPPAGRWEFTSPVPRFGGFLEDISLFDAAFFGISPREAAAMDPQQRLVLELSWRALESARILPDKLRGTRTGVFIGSIWDDYSALLSRFGEPGVTQHSITGLHRSIIANRVSYFLGLRGPSATVDTGQSSSLVAVHAACQSLRRGESTVAIAGGVNLNIAPQSTVGAAMFGGLSPDGRCFTFDARANGYVRGEGGATVVLKTLSRAQQDGDNVHCVILGSAVNNDGATESLTAPSREGQEEVLREAYAQARIDPARVQYVELHGTGTRLGDPIEAAALGAVFRRAGDAEPLRVGSAKTNVGHLEGAAGITGLLKAVLCIAHRRVPASLNFQAPNPEIPLDELGLEVSTALGPWPDEQRELIAGVSSFGLGGTNCHLVLAEAPRNVSGSSEPERRDDTAALPWVISAKTGNGVREQASRLRAHLLERPELANQDVAHSLATTRTHFEHRAAVLADNRDEALAGLAALSTDAPSPVVLHAGARASGVGKRVFVFPGQGSQWPEMARELFATSPVFAGAIRACAAALEPHVEWNLLEILTGEDTAAELERVEVVQPALWAMMIGLARLWRSYGLEPDAVVGHSQGEIAAAYVAGALSLEDSAKVVALRSKAIASLAGTGAMASINLPVEAIRERLARLTDHDLHIATINGRSSTVVAGDAAQIDDLVAGCDAEEIRARLIPVDYASHTPHVLPLRDRILADLAGITPRTSDIPFYSTLTGELIDTSALDAGYWFNNLASTVNFYRASQEMFRAGHTLFIEVSPHPVLTAPLTDTVTQEADADLASTTVGTAIGTLRRDHGDLAQFTAALTQAHLHGHSPDWGTLLPDSRQVDLPTYAFQQQHYWLEAPPGQVGPATLGIDAAAAIDRPVPASAEVATTDLGRRLVELSEADQHKTVLELITGHIASILGHAGADDIPVGQTFKEIGFDSLSSVELRNRLNATSGLTLPTSLIFDHPTPTALAVHLRAALRGAPAPAPKAHPPGRSDEPVAIVAMACRYPGDVRSAEDLWQLVSDGREAITEFPDNRGWDLENLYDPEQGMPGKSYVNRGGFLHEADRFDAHFFGVSPREASAMDPQQRLLLESSWEAFERAGVDPQTLVKPQVGVFVGAMSQDYGPRMHEQAGGSEGYLLTGSTASVTSGRVAYSFGFEGPAVTVDTACSSSLVAMHLAIQALHSGECSLALACGTTVMSSPGMFVEFSRQRGLSPDGRCKAFAASADGTAWAEGVGVLILERLSDARANGHEVLALVRGSSVNQDGASNGLTAPNGPSQERVIRQALANAGLDTGDVDVVEAHGTGTSLGDPIEAQALLATYGHDRDPERPLWLGSLKSNVGHTQAAAGVAGVIKMVQAMHHGVLPQTLHADEPSPHVDWESGAVSLLTEAREWITENDRPRRAAVSSFGISGTNAHVILEQDASPAPSVSGESDQTEDPTSPAASPLPWVLSAKTEQGLCEQAARLRTHLAHNPDLATRDIAFSLATGRTHFEHRAAVLADDRDQALADLAALSSSTPSPTVLQASGRLEQGGLAFVFSGQGSQRAGMGRELAGAFPVFAEALDEICGLFDEHLETPLREVILAEPGAEHDGLIDQTAYTQAGLFAVECALFRLLDSLGVRPDAVIGHSIGEIAAAHVAGVISLPDAVTMVAARGAMMQEARDNGAMIAIAATEAEVLAALGDRTDQVGIAAVNAPQAVVISGDADVAEDIMRRFTAEGRKARRLKVSHAFHSPYMDQAAARFQESIIGIKLREPRIPLISNVTGELAEADTVTSPEYWAQHIRRPVRFADGIGTLAGRGITSYLELGPDSVLSAMADATLTDTETSRTCGAGSVDTPLLTATMRADRSETATFITALTLAHLHGHSPRWPALLPGARLVDLPTYPFQRERYWLDTPSGGGDPAEFGIAAAVHPLLGAAAQLPGGHGWLFTARLSLASQPWIADHAVLDTVVLPGTAYIDLALDAAAHTDTPCVEELTLHAPLVLDGETSLQLRLRIGQFEESSSTRGLTLHSRPAAAAQAAGRDTDPGDGEDSGWTRHASATLIARAGADSPDTGWAGTWPPPTAMAVDLESGYQRLVDRGYEYGPLFQGLRAMWLDGDDTYAEVALPEDSDTGGYGIHPALLDAALHPLVMPAGNAPADESPDEAPVRLPFAWAGVVLRATGASSLRVRISRTGEDVYRLSLADPCGAPVADVESLTLRAIDPAQLAASRRAGEAGYELNWAPLTAPAEPGTYRTQVLSGLDTSAIVDSPEVVVVPAQPVDGAEVPAATHELVGGMLRFLQAFLGRDDLTDARLVVLTRAGVTVGDEDAIPDLPSAAIWGLVRTAQAENPDRITLLDVEPGAPETDAESAGQVLSTGEPQVAVRNGTLYAARLVRVAPPDPAPEPVLDAEGTVLITGGTGTLGALMARHLVTEYGTRHLLLVSRRGPDAPGASALRDELAELGAQVRLQATDTADADAVRALVASVDAEHPLNAVIHTAGVLDDSTLTAMTGDQLDRVLTPKVDAAWHLHQATAEADLAAFVLYSSATGTLGNPGQANYTAANTFLDGLARHRRHGGLAATSLAWGLWSENSGMTGHLRDQDIQRMRRSGLKPLTDQEGLSLFDAALAVDIPNLVTTHLTTPAFQKQQDAGVLPPIFRNFVRVGTPRAAASAQSIPALPDQLSGLAGPEQRKLVLDTVRSHIAAVLALPDPDGIDNGQGLLEMGFDSLTAVELRNRLNAVTGLRLPSTFALNYPTADAMSEFLVGELATESGGEQATDSAHDAQVRTAIAGIPIARIREAGLLNPLMKLTEPAGEPEPEQPENTDDIESADADALIKMALSRNDS